jgi:hypothetical protein
MGIGPKGPLLQMLADAEERACDAARQADLRARGFGTGLRSVDRKILKAVRRGLPQGYRNVPVVFHQVKRLDKALTLRDRRF